MSDDGFDEIIVEFLEESLEGLDQLDRDLVELEQNPTDESLLAAIFRCIHTIKGSSGLLGFTALEAVSHSGESLLSLLRDGKLVLNAAITTAILAMGDAVREILDAVERTGSEGAADYSALIAELQRLAEPGDAELEDAEPKDAPPDDAVPHEIGSVAEVVGGAADVPPEVDAPAPTKQSVREEHHNKTADSSIRVNVSQLDNLMNLVGELVLARNQILQLTPAGDDAAFLATSQRLNLITSELQEGVMKSRMQPIGQLWGKLPRLVRDLALQLGKEVRLEMEGKETELDRTILEAIKDPLTHIVRNSIDHGIGTPEDRVASGKPREGCLLLRAYHEGGQINLEITDDGRGIDAEKMKNHAVEKGLISAEQAARLSTREAINLIFRAGFTTAESLTNVSGRGVGMDVVRTNIEKIGGTVDLQSRLGQGTTLKVKIPLTLAIVPALIVKTGGERYAIPQVSLLELVRLDGETAGQQIEMIHGATVYRLRGKLLPLIYLNRELELGDPPDDTDGSLNIVVLQADEESFGLVVDEVLDTEEIVVKPLGQQLKGLDVFAGSTVMGDGEVALIADVLGIAQRSGVLTHTSDRRKGTEHDEASDHNERESLLVVQMRDRSRLAIPLSQVARLEEISGADIEWAAQREVVQYRSQIMPLIRLDEVVGRTRTFEADGGEDPDVLYVVVCTQGESSVGLVVEKILDIVNQTVTLADRTESETLLGSIVLDGKVTDLLDVERVVRRHEPHRFAEPVGVSNGTGAFDG